MYKQDLWKRPRTAALAVALTLSLAAFGVAGGTHVWSEHHVALKLAGANDAPSHTGFAAVVKNVLPAVVNISSSRPVKTEQMLNPKDDPFFRQFFGNNDGSISHALWQRRWIRAPIPHAA
jgi:S1-C subfamily serine protease